MTGITFAGIERLPQEQRPPKEILLGWYSNCEAIKKKNAELNKKCAIVSDKFGKEGFRNCILKGQGLAQLYPDPKLRTPGDIDIWLEGGVQKVLPYVKKYFPKCKPTYHHVDFPISNDLEIEIHYRPSWAFSPFKNKRMQEYFASQSNRQFSNCTKTDEGEFPVPTADFNRIYVLIHIYRHLFFEGIGMRQILDYYYVMQQDTTDNEKESFIATLKHLGLFRFAGAVSYILKNIFHIDDEKTIVAPDATLGKFLLREIMIAGNFGKHDPRYDYSKRSKKAYNIAKRSIILISHFPGETIWSPYFKIWHYIWRKRKG